MHLCPKSTILGNTPFCRATSDNPSQHSGATYLYILYLLHLEGEFSGPIADLKYRSILGTEPLLHMARLIPIRFSLLLELLKLSSEEPRFTFTLKHCLYETLCTSIVKYKTIIMKKYLGRSVVRLGWKSSTLRTATDAET